MSVEACARHLIKPAEGLELMPYRCTAGKMTIGYGRNIEEVGITAGEAEILLNTDIKACHRQLMQKHYWQFLDTARKAVLIDMVYNLGWNRFKGFRKMSAALVEGRYTLAAAEILDSKYANQLPSRALRNAQIMKAGVIDD